MLAEALKTKRIEKGWKVDPLAMRLGVSRDLVYRWQRTGDVPIFMLLRIAACLGVTLAELVAPALFADMQNAKIANQNRCNS